MTSLDHLLHLAEEEREQQGADVAAVDVGVAQQDDLVVTDLVDLELVTEAGAETGEEVRDRHRLDQLAVQKSNQRKNMSCACLCFRTR